MTALTTPNRNRTFVRELERQADRRPDGVYLWHDGVPTTFGEQRTRACSLANQLGALGISRGDRVATLAGNCASFVDLWLGAPQAGVMNVLLNTALRGSFLAHQLRDCRAKMIFVDDDLVPRLGEIADDLTDLEFVVVRDRTGSDGVAVASELLPGRTVVPASFLGDGDTETWPATEPLDWNEPSLVVYTSGTTGRSKGVVQTQHYLCSAAEAMNEAVRTTDADVQYSALPLFHNAGIMGVLTTSLLAGRPTALDSTFHVSTCWDRIRAVGATQFLAVGPMLKMLYGLPPSPEDAQLPLRAIIGAPFPADFHRDLERRYDCRVVQGYAMTEVTFVAVHRLDGSTVMPGSAGPISPLYDVGVFDGDDRELPAGSIGEIVVRPRHPHVMFESYLDLPDQTQAQMRNLWFHTGDLGRFDGDGNLFFVDRKKDAMRLRGENVSSFEVEESVAEHPAIVECAAIAVPSPLGEDDIKICVVLEQGAELSPEQVLDYCVSRMPRFAVPRYVEFVDVLPRTPTMRIQKFLLREQGVTQTTWDREAAGYVVPR